MEIDIPLGYDFVSVLKINVLTIVHLELYHTLHCEDLPVILKLVLYTKILEPTLCVPPVMFIHVLDIWNVHFC